MGRLTRCSVLTVILLAFTGLFCSSAPKADLATIMQKNGHFKTAIKLIKASGLASTIDETGPYTVFAPTDKAFAKLPKGTVEKLLKPENKSQLISMILYHAATGKISTACAKKKKDGVKVITLSGGTAKLVCTGKCAKINNVRITTADISASNGILHILDSVLVPPKEK